MYNLRRASLAISVLLTLLLSLLITQPVQAAFHYQEVATTLQISNDSHATICSIYVAAKTVSGWGNDYLNGARLLPTETRAITLTPGTYDVLLLGCNGEKLFVKPDIDIDHQYRFTLTDGIVKAQQCHNLNQAGAEAYDRSSYKTAASLFPKALLCFQEIGDRVQEGNTLNNIAHVRQSQGRYQEALQTYEQALTTARDGANRAGEGSALNGIASVYSEQGRIQKALEMYEEALTIAREVKDRDTEGTLLHNIAYVYDSQGHYQKALETYEEALAIARELKDRDDEAATLNNIALVYNKQARYEEALKTFERALTIVREVGDRAGEGRVLYNIASIYRFQGRYQEARKSFEQALSIARNIGDTVGQAAALTAIADAYEQQGNNQEALNTYKQALALRRDVGDRDGEGTILNDIAMVYYHLGRYQEAIDTSQHALAILREIGNRRGEGSALSTIAAVFGSEGRYKEALDTYEQVLAIAREVGDRTAEGAALNGIAYMYHNRGNAVDALETYQQALVIQREVGNRNGEAATLNNIALAYIKQEKYQVALETLEAALIILREVGDPYGESNALTNIGYLYDDQGRYPEALDMYQQALVLARQIGDVALEGEILNNIAHVYRKQKLHQRALDTFEQAADMLESVRTAAGSERAQASFINQYIPVYTISILGDLFLHQPVAAFVASERGRARAFLDSLATSKVQLDDVRNADLLADEREAYAIRQAAQDALVTAHSLTPPDPALVAQREAELQKADQQLEQTRNKIAAQGEQLAALVPGRSTVLTLPQVQALLDKQTTLVSFWMLEDKTLAFVVTADDFSLVELPDATLEAVQDAVESLYAWKSRENPYPRPLRNLYSWLVAPLAPHLKTPYVAIVPHQQLHYVPFAALTDGEHYFGQQHILSLLPSATSLQFLQQNARTAQQLGWNKVLIFGNPTTTDLPPLPAAEHEAQAVGALFHTAIYTGPQASEARLRQQVEGSAIVHLAAHGSYNEANPLYSAITLAPDDSDKDKEDNDGGRLEAREVYALPLKGTKLVTLSACQSSVGTLSQGDEVVGLTRAFFFAGTPSVLSSLWAVDDAATGALMTAFYRNWQQKGMDKAAALQAAQAAVAANPLWRSPFFWAAFVLNGDTGKTK